MLKSPATATASGCSMVSTLTAEAAAAGASAGAAAGCAAFGRGLALPHRLGHRGHSLLDELGGLAGNLGGFRRRFLGRRRPALLLSLLPSPALPAGSSRQRRARRNGSAGVERCSEGGRLGESHRGALAVVGDGPAGAALDQPAGLDQLGRGGGQRLVAAGNAAAEEFAFVVVEGHPCDCLAQHGSGVQLLAGPYLLCQDIQHGLEPKVGVFRGVRAHGSPLEAIDPPAFCQGNDGFCERNPVNSVCRDPL